MEDFFKKYWLLLSILLLFFIAIVIRFYKLGVIPHGMTWDEAAIGYNGYSVLTTRRDEWLNFMPISFQSFGDYKAPLAIYMNGLFTAIFGMNLFAVRLPFTIISIFSIASLMWFVYELFNKATTRTRKLLSIFGGFILTVSPWHVHYSRAGFESGIALFLLTFGLAAITRFRNTKFRKLIFLYLSLLSFSAAVYAYHSSKIVIPLLLLSLLVVYKKQVLRNYKRYLLPAFVFVLTLVPFLYDAVYGEGLTRAGVTFLSDTTLSFTEKATLFLNNYLSHLSIPFLLQGETTTLRHGVGSIGVLYPTTLILVVFGLLALWSKKLRRGALTGLLLILFGILPAALASEVPHSNRAFLALPGFIILALVGLQQVSILTINRKSFSKIIGSHGEKSIVLKAILGTFLAVHVVFAVNFLSYYFTTFAQQSAEAFRDGYLEAFEIAQEYELGLNGKPEVEKVLFSSEYGQPYIYALFVKETNPIWYQGGSLIKYEFTDRVSVGELVRKNTLVVGTQESNLPLRKADHVVYGSDGSVRFVLIYTGDGGT